MARTLAGSLAAALALAGCQISGNLGGGSAVVDPETQRAWLESLRVPVAKVGRLELGRSRDGYALAAFGTVEGVGWTAPQLRPRTPIVAPDGMIELDFVAVPPQPPAAPPDPASAPPAAPAGRFAPPPMRADTSRVVESRSLARAPAPPPPPPDRTPTRIRADRTLAPELIAQAQGVRVWAAQGSVEGRF